MSQPLSASEARGVVTGYRVESNVLQLNTAVCQPQQVISATTTSLISGQSLSHAINVNLCASYVVTVNARTAAGFNETLTLNEIIIFSSATGLLQ